MILLKCKDYFILSSLRNLFGQKNILVSTKDSSNFFFDIEIDINKDNQIRIHDKKRTLTLERPIIFEIFFSKFIDFLSNTLIRRAKFDYNPISQLIYFENQTSYLGSIHNSIISSLLLNIDTGVNKLSLYGKIWPNDKNIQINKLDTHITNLKNKLNNDLGFDLNLVSISGNLKLIID